MQTTGHWTTWSRNTCPLPTPRSRRHPGACSTRCRWPSIRPIRLARTSRPSIATPRAEPYRFLDMGALIATQAFGENDPAVVEAVLNHLPFAFSRYAHSEYQTVLSLRLKAELNRIAPAGTPRHFVVNTGAEAVENAIKSVLLNRVMTTGDPDGGFIISFEGAFHGRTLGSLAVTHRKKARLGFPTFDWPHVSFPVEDGSAEGDGAPRGAQPQAALGPARLGPAAARREEQGHVPARAGRDRRVPGDAGPGRGRVRPRPARGAQLPTPSDAAAGSRRCWSSRSRARAACA